MNAPESPAGPYAYSESDGKISRPEHPAAALRRAAALMRERAEAASKGPWKSWVEGRDHRGGDSMIATGDDGAGSGDLYVHVGPGYHEKWEADQDYIAAMHPLVALAVADLLDAVATASAVHLSAPHSNTGRLAVAIARAYLGETETEGAEQ